MYNIIYKLTTLILYIVTSYYFYKVIANFSSVKDNKYAKFASIFGAYLVPNVIIYTSDIVNIFYTMIGFILIMVVFYKSSYIKNISAVMIFYPIVVSINLMANDFCTKVYFYLGKTLWMDYFAHTLEMCIISLSWFLIYHFSKDKLSNIDRYIDIKTWIMIDIICLAPFISIISTNINTPIGKEYQAYPIAIACIVTSLSMIFLIEYIVKSVKNRLENQNLKLEYSYYRELEENQKNVRKLNHDMNNHLSVIYSFLEYDNLEGAKEYFNELSGKFNVSNRVFCKNSIVNAVINSKYNLAIKNQIDCFFNIDIDEILPLEDIDICSIFSNTLDNAIEASLKLDDISKRKISLKARCDKGYFSFSICNNYNGIIKFNKGKYSSTKSDSSMHGFGLENVSEIVNKYSGTLDINYSEFEFNILAIIKIT
ncbi:two-component sensor histidine kinase [[Clostridium] sordellii]|uniref:sensor histidine kinase n=1 Tax=Paraclostridium sordellii TaxID=1505 RepID=UPI0005DC83C2|nr:sensor histidine kinase [Paeniclostridium sordellii]CEO35584.1 two-component sensor histidine kinase [[Clostridium] sordellii] [Paeniclostridium sordellii]CEP92712.1 two-component sensor histidine kinase [[Clostridium] sordellii] [Paeniclostridium sordellii]